VADDGLAFDLGSVKGEEIREDTEYGGIRIKMVAMLSAAEIRLQVDIGFGDTVVPGPEMRSYPLALGGEPIPVLAYPREAALAEKLESIVVLGMRDSRMKDFYDLHFLATHFGFAGPVVRDAIHHTFRRRGTPLPQVAPVGLTEEFTSAPERAAQWRAFVKRGRLAASPVTLPSLLRLLRLFLLPPLEAARAGQEFDQAWSPGGPWR
jgi:hypothetical protein